MIKVNFCQSKILIPVANGSTGLMRVATPCKVNMVSQRKSCSFCINLYHVAMVLLMCFYYGASDKLTFMLYSDKLGFTLLLDLTIDLSQLQNLEIHQKSRNATKSRALFLIVHYSVFSIAKQIFSTGSWTFADCVPFL